MMACIHTYGCFIVANLIFLLLSTFQNNVSLLLPSIQKEIILNVNHTQWIISTPLTITTIFMIMLGRLTDIFNRMYIVKLALLCFLLGNILSALSTTFNSLFIGRILQGLGAASMLPQSYVLVKQDAKGNNNDKLFHYFVCISTLFLIIGPGIAGILCVLLGWRWVFLTGAILSCCTLYVSIHSNDYELFRNRKGDKTIDYLGVILIALFSLNSIFCINAKVFHVGFWLCGSIATISFFLLKRHLTTYPSPIINITLFKHKSFPLYTLVLCTMQITMASTYIISFALQNIFRFNAAESGILLAVTMSPSIFTACLITYMQTLFHANRLIQIALLMLCLGNVSIGYAGYYNNIYLLIVGRLVISIFISILFSLGMKTILDREQTAQQGTVSALIYQFREFSNTFCVTAMHMIAFSTRENIQITNMKFAYAMLVPISSAFITLIIFTKKQGRCQMHQ